MAYEQVDLANVTFKDFIDNKANDGNPGKFSFVLRGYVRKWCNDLDRELEKLKFMIDVPSGSVTVFPSISRVTSFWDALLGVP